MFTKVMVGVDGSAAALGAALTASRLGLFEGAKVELVGALDLNRVTLPALQLLDDEERRSLRRSVRERYLEPARAALQALDADTGPLHVVEDLPSEALWATAKAREADLIVVGRRGMGAVKRFFLGSVSARLIELSEVPVLVVPDREPGEHTINWPEPGTLVVATDFSTEARLGVDVAAELAKAKEWKLVVVHCTPLAELLPVGAPDGSFAGQLDWVSLQRDFVERASRMLDELVAELEAKGVKVEGRVSDRTVVEGINEVAESVDAGVVVLASHGRSGFEKFWLGSMATGVLRRCERPVLVIPVRAESD